MDQQRAAARAARLSRRHRQGRPRSTSPRALKSARILNDYGFPDKAEQFVARIRAKTGDNLSARGPHRAAAHRGARRPVEGRVDRVGELLNQLVELDPANGEVLLELGPPP